MKWKFYTKVLLLSCAIHGTVLATDADKQIVLNTVFSNSNANDRTPAKNGKAALERLAAGGDPVAKDALSAFPSIGTVHERNAVKYYQQNQRVIQAASSQQFQVREEEIKKREHAIQQLEIRLQEREQALEEHFAPSINKSMMIVGETVQTIEDYLRSFYYFAWNHRVGKIPETLKKLQEHINQTNEQIDGVQKDQAIYPLNNYLILTKMPINIEVLKQAEDIIKAARTSLTFLQNFLDINAMGALISGDNPKRKYERTSVLKALIAGINDRIGYCLSGVPEIDAFLDIDDYIQKMGEFLNLFSENFVKTEKDKSTLEELIGGFDSEKELDAKVGTLAPPKVSLMTLVKFCVEEYQSNAPARGEWKRIIGELLDQRRILYEFAKIALKDPEKSLLKNFPAAIFQKEALPDNFNRMRDVDVDTGLKRIHVKAILDSFFQTKTYDLMRNMQSIEEQNQFIQEFDAAKKGASRQKKTVMEHVEQRFKLKEKFLNGFLNIGLAMNEFLKTSKTDFINPKDAVRAMRLIAFPGSGPMEIRTLIDRLKDNLKRDTIDSVNVLFDDLEKKASYEKKITLDPIDGVLVGRLGDNLSQEVQAALEYHANVLPGIQQNKYAYDLLKRITVAREKHQAFLKTLRNILDKHEMFQQYSLGDDPDYLRANKQFLMDLFQNYIGDDANYITLPSELRARYFYHTLSALSQQSSWSGPDIVALTEPLEQAYKAYLEARDAIVAINPSAMKSEIRGGDGIVIAGFNMAGNIEVEANMVHLPVVEDADAPLPPPPPSVMGGGGPPPPPPPGMGGGFSPPGSSSGVGMRAPSERDIWKNFFIETMDHIFQSITQMPVGGNPRTKVWNDVVEAWMHYIQENLKSLEIEVLKTEDLARIATPIINAAIAQDLERKKRADAAKAKKAADVVS